MSLKFKAAGIISFLIALFYYNTIASYKVLKTYIASKKLEQVKIKYFPFPSLKGIYSEENSLSKTKFKIELSPLSFLSSTPKIDSMHIEDISLTSNNASSINDLIDNFNLHNLLQLNLNLKLSNIEKLTISNLKLITKIKGLMDSEKEIVIPYMELKSSGENAVFSGIANFDQLQIPINGELIYSNSNINLKLSNNDFNFSLEQSLISNHGNISLKYKNSSLKDTLIQIKGEDLDFKSSYTSADSMFKLTNLEFKAGNLKATGSAAIDLLNPKNNNLNLSLENGIIQNKIVSILYGHKFLPLKFYIVGHDFRFLENKFNFTLEGSSSNESINFKTLTLLGSGREELNFDGVTQNGYTSGNLSLKDFNLSKFLENSNDTLNLDTSININSDGLQVKNLNGTIAGATIKGESNLSDSKDTFNINIDGLNFDKFEVGMKYLNNLSSGLLQVKESPLNLYSIMQNLKDTKYNINFNNSSFKGAMIDSLNIQCSTRPNSISIENFKIATKQGTNMEASFKASLIDLLPYINLEIKGGAISFERITEDAWNKVLQFLKSIDFNKLNLSSNIKLSSFGLGNTISKDLIAQIEVKDSQLLIKNLEASALKGRITLSGTIENNQNTLKSSFAYGLNLIDTSYIRNFIPLNIRDGIISIVATGEFEGNSLKENIYKLKLDGNFINKGSSIEGINIDQFISKIRSSGFDPQFNYEALLDSGNTNFNEIKGTFKLVQGILLTNDITLVSKNSSGAFAGSYNLYNFDSSFISSFSFYPQSPLTPASSLSEASSIQGNNQNLNIPSGEPIKIYLNYNKTGKASSKLWNIKSVISK